MTRSGEEVVVIGSGFAGLAAADDLVAAGVPVVVLEAEEHWGGHTHSTRHEGHLFDEGPHVSFTSDERVRDRFQAGAGHVSEFAAHITNYHRRHWIEHPAQCHLYGLDPDLVSKCIVDLAAAAQRTGPVKNYEEWCRATYGDTFAETFPMAYTRKYWTVEADAMATDWIGPRMYKPTLEEMVRGALSPSQDRRFHYLSEFRYPAEGGYQAFMRSFVREDVIMLGARVVEVDPADRTVTLADGSSLGYRHLISTMPLPELVEAVRPGQVPADVAEAAARLLCTSLVLVDVAVERPDLSEHHWFYVYDDSIAFSRGHFPHMLAASNAPRGRGSIQLEIYHSRHRPLSSAPELLPERCVEELVGMGVLRGAAEVLWARHRCVPYANVVFDRDRAAALAVILPWVRAQGIDVAGRYGEWGYHWTDDAVRSGWAAAERARALVG